MAGNPTIQDVHFNQTLTNFSVSWISDNTKYASGQNGFPTVPVLHKSDNYWRFEKADLLRSAMRPRAIGSEAAEAGYSVDPNSLYVCKNWALKMVIADDKRRNADPAIDLDRNATNFLSDQMLRAQEQDFYAKYMHAGVWGIDYIIPSNLYWDLAGSTPIKTMRAQIVQAESQSGYPVDTMVIGKRVWAALQDNADFISRVNFGTPAPAGQAPNPSQVTLELLAMVLGLKRVIVASAAQCTSQKGVTPRTYDFISGKDALLIYAPPTAQLEEPTAGAKFVWTGRDNAGADGQILRRYRDDARKADVVEIECAWSFDIVCQELGIYFPQVIS